MLIAGGGTGGHLFPGLALAEEMILRNQGHEVLFVGTRRGLETRHVPKAGFQLELIDVGGLKGRGLWGWIRGLLRLPRALWQSRRVLRRFKPDVVVGVGGYASGPVLLTAWLMRLPTMILEQNALPGFTNKILGKFVRRVVVAFEQAARFFKPAKVQLLGNPVRKALAENLLDSKEEERGHRVLVFGGSQGARILNEIVPRAAAELNQRFADLEIMHQTGDKDLEKVRQQYGQLGMSADIQPFIDDMAAAYRWADLAICRAGATTVAELSLCRKPAILIPFPYAADNHQEVNAGALVDAGAALMIRQADLNPKTLADKAGIILGDDGQRTQMQQAAAVVSRPEAARDICEVCLELANKSRWRRKENA